MTVSSHFGTVEGSGALPRTQSSLVDGTQPRFHALRGVNRGIETFQSPIRAPYVFSGARIGVFGVQTHRFTPRRAWNAAAMVTSILMILLLLAGCSSTPTAPGSAPASSPTSASSTAPTDGSYTIEVTLSGGSGKANVDSPTMLTVAGGQMTATITWSSPYYTWMEVGGVQYTPTSGQGENATFEIPVILDTDVAITAETTAMSEPHDIDYTLHFDSSTMKSA